MDRSMALRERPQTRQALISLDRERDELLTRDVWNDRQLEGLVIGMSQAEKAARLDRAAASLRGAR